MDADETKGCGCLAVCAFAVLFMMGSCQDMVERDPDMDADFRSICAMRNDMAASLNTLRIKIEDAYLASLKYEATPSRMEYDVLRRKLIEDGMQEAEAAARRFNDMRMLK